MTKQETYQTLLPQIQSLVAGEQDMIANMANVAAALHEAFGFWWTGFYIVRYERVNDLTKKSCLEGAKNERMTEEFGDVLFALINAARLYKIKPDNALEQTNLKFIKRFNYIEARAKEQGKELKDMTLEQMEELWQEAKGKE